MEEIRMRARAKINLTLDVTGKREDGYHLLQMVMQNVALYDDITIRRRQEVGIVLTSNLPWLPCDERNLAWRAACLMQEEFGLTEGVEIHIQKRIPVAAGLAGGSTDCAAVLVGMKRLFGLRVSQKKLEELGLRLGADVPYCIRRGTVLAEGIGEILTDINPQCPPFFVVLAKPNVSVSTKSVYQKLKLDEICNHPDTEGMLAAIAAQDHQAICEKMGNVLENVTIPDYPIIAALKERLLELGAENAMMSGSGPTVFGLFLDEKQAKKAAKKVQREFSLKEVVTTRTFCPARSGQKRKERGKQYGETDNCIK